MGFDVLNAPISPVFLFTCLPMNQEVELSAPCLPAMYDSCYDDGCPSAAVSQPPFKYFLKKSCLGYGDSP